MSRSEQQFDWVEGKYMDRIPMTDEPADVTDDTEEPFLDEDDYDDGDLDGDDDYDDFEDDDYDDSDYIEEEGTLA